MGINPAGKIDYKPIADANFESNKLQVVGGLPADVMGLIMAKISSSNLATASLIGRPWLKGADQEHKNILLTYLRTIANELDWQVYTNQKNRLLQLAENASIVLPEILRTPTTKKLIAQELVNILCEVRANDIDKIVLNPNYIPPEFANILDIAKRTFKGDMHFGTVGRIFTKNFSDPELAGRLFILNGIDLPSKNGSGKWIATDEHILYFYQDSRTVRFPRYVEDRVLEGKNYGDVIHFSIAKPFSYDGKPPKGPLHFMLRLVPKENAQPGQTLEQKVEQVLTHPETTVDKFEEQYQRIVMKADEPNVDNK